MKIIKIIQRAIKEPEWFLSAMKNYLKNPQILLTPLYKKKRERIIRKNAEQIDDFFFVQIGAHDGVSRDPIHKYIIQYRWGGAIGRTAERRFSFVEKQLQRY